MKDLKIFTNNIENKSISKRIGSSTATNKGTRLRSGRMKKYKKVTDEDVLVAYKKMQDRHYEVGLWLDYIPISLMAIELKTSKYQVQKAYKSLKEKGLMKIEQYPTFCEEYDNGLYIQDIPMLFAKVYVISSKGEEYLKEKNY